MKLSVAIREGAKLRPQGRGHFFTENHQGLCSCALGAAYESRLPPSERFVDAMEYGDRGPVSDFLFTTFPALFNKAMCPATATPSTVFPIVVHLNDKKYWTREQIADWLESEGL